ncbi:MAG: Ig-like domain-containing protein [Gemmatimonadetes bacterium]|nr:Ig-like domain-containing protein [Gemmatimonadota bacterium]
MPSATRLSFRRLLFAALGIALIINCSGGGKDAPTAPVAPVVVGSVTVGGTPAEGALLVGGSVTLSATAVSTTGSTVSGRTTTWSSSDPSVATVAAGAVVGVASGPVTISASVDGVVGRTTLSVRVPISTPPAGASTPTVAAVLSGAVTLTIPPTAVPTGTALSVAPAALPSDNRVVPATTYVFGPDGTTFSSPLTLALRYDKAAVATADQSTLWLASVDASGVATPIAGSAVDLTTGVVSAPVSHFSSYTIIKPAAPASIAVASGDAQSATVGTSPATALSVRVLDAASRPVPAATVRFAVASGNGAISGTATATTNYLGVATLAGQWVLGSGSGSQSLTATPTTGTVTAATFTATAIAGAASKLELSGAATQVAAASQTITITAKDANGNTATGYTGAKSLTFGGAATAPGGQKPTAGGTAFGTATSVTFTNGVATLPVVLNKAEAATLSVTDGTITAATADQLAVVVSHGAPSASTSTLSISADSVIVGNTLSVTLTLSDGVGNRTTTATSAAFVATPSSGSFGAWTCTAGVCSATYSTPSAATTATLPITIGGTALSGTSPSVRVLAAVATLTATLGSSSVFPGATTQASVVLKDGGGSTLTGRPITWASSNSSIATITNAGAVTVLAYTGGATRVDTLTATSEGKAGLVVLTVNPTPVATVTVTPSPVTITAGSTQVLSAVLSDAAGTALTGRSVAWTTSNASVATVASTGTVTAVSVGNATITATAEGRSATASVTVQDGLIAYYPFSGNANDASGFGHHGVVTGATLTTDRFGAANSAYYFAQGTNQIAIGDINLNGAFTLSAWVKKDAKNSGSGLISRYAADNSQGFELNLPADSTANHGYCVVFHSRGSAGPVNACRPTIAAGSWYHLAATLDASGNGSIYVDGVLMSTMAGMLPDLFRTGYGVLLGRCAWGCTALGGSLDEVRIYSRALSQSEVAALSNNRP